MAFTFKTARMTLPDTESNQYEGKGDLIPIHPGLCVEKTIMEEVAQGTWAPTGITIEDNSAPIIHVEPNGDMLMNFRAVTGADRSDFDNPYWLDAQAVIATDAITFDDVELDDIIDAIVFLSFDEEQGFLRVFIDTDVLKGRDDFPEVFFYTPESSDEVEALCQNLKDAGFLFVREAEDREATVYNSIVNPACIISICYHDDNTHGLEFTAHNGEFLGVINTQAEMIKMLGEDLYYDLGYFHDWGTFKQVPLRDLPDGYLSNCRP